MKIQRVERLKELGSSTQQLSVRLCRNALETTDTGSGFCRKLADICTRLYTSWSSNVAYLQFLTATVSYRICQILWVFFLDQKMYSIDCSALYDGCEETRVKL